jgi:acetyl esterase/lipase
MQRKNRRLIWATLLTLVLVVAPLSWMLLFLYSNRAPITRGTIAYDVPYYNDKTLDIYYPTVDTEKSPVVFFVHGGAWMGGVKESINFNRINRAVDSLREKGYTLISPQYTLARDGNSPFPDCITDLYRALSWTYKNADSLKLDMDRTGVIGESAGAHIAMMIAFADPAAFEFDDTLPQIDYVVDIYGPTDLWSLYHSQSVDSLIVLTGQLPASLRGSFDVPQRLFGFDPEADSLRTKAFTDRYSPIAHVQASAPPVLMIHGNKDIVVPVEQSLELKRVLDSLHATSKLHVLEGVNHGFIGASEAQRDSIEQYIFKFIVNRYHGN